MKLKLRKHKALTKCCTRINYSLRSQFTGEHGVRLLKREQFMLFKVFLFALVIASSSYALDKNGNFESKAEQDSYISATLKKTAKEMNSQAPFMLDEETKFKSSFALNKTLSFTYELINFSSKELTTSGLQQLNKTIWENMNDNACKVQATRTLIDLGVSYVYIYFGNDDRLITRVVLDKYICEN